MWVNTSMTFDQTNTERCIVSGELSRTAWPLLFVYRSPRSKKCSGSREMTSWSVPRTDTYPKTSDPSPGAAGLGCSEWLTAMSTYMSQSKGSRAGLDQTSLLTIILAIIIKPPSTFIVFYSNVTFIFIWLCSIQKRRNSHFSSEPSLDHLAILQYLISFFSPLGESRYFV